MKYPVYPQYKDSGVEWLGAMPEHWEAKRLSYLALLKSGENITSEQIAEGGDYPVYGGNGLRGFYSSYTHEGFYALIGRQGALCGNVNYANGKFWASEHAIVVTPITSFAPKWLGELLRAMNLNQYSVSAAQPGLSVSMIASLKIPVPPCLEQTAIADFLDSETGRIDTLVAKKRKLVALLKEKRSALISRTVTRGLPADAAREFGLTTGNATVHEAPTQYGRGDFNHPKTEANKFAPTSEPAPSQAFKDSGVEWLGAIPENWEIKRLKNVTKILRGKFSHRPRNDPRLYDGDYPFIQTGDVSGANKFIVAYQQTLNEEGFSVSKMFPKGTLVMTIAANIGDVAILDFEACFPDSIVGFVPGHKIQLEFLYFLFQAMRSVLFSTATLNTQMNLNVERIGSLEAAIPPLNEQTAIAAYLDRETAKIDRLVAKVETAIDRLREYRSALITAAVTGKIDVREAL